MARMETEARTKDTTANHTSRRRQYTPKTQGICIGFQKVRKGYQHTATGGYPCNKSVNWLRRSAGGVIGRSKRDTAFSSRWHCSSRRRKPPKRCCPGQMVAISPPEEDGGGSPLMDVRLFIRTSLADLGRRGKGHLIVAVRHRAEARGQGKWACR